MLAAVVLSFAVFAVCLSRRLLCGAVRNGVLGNRYATQDTLLKALIAEVLPEGKRNLAFGLFYTGYGAGWLIGSIVTGLLYEQSRPALVIFAIIAQLASLPLFALGAAAPNRAKRTLIAHDQDMTSCDGRFRARAHKSLITSAAPLSVSRR